MSEKCSWRGCLLVELVSFGSCFCLGVGTVLGDMGGVLADDVFEAEFVGLRFKAFLAAGVSRGKEEVINAITSSEVR